MLGYTFVDLDREYSLSRGTCRLAVSSPSTKGEKAIADTFGMHPKEI